MATEQDNIAETNQEYSNDSIRIKVIRKPHSLIEYEVEASSSLAKEAYQQAAKIVAKEVEIPGFRKGKAPVEMVAKKYPQDIEKKWQDSIAHLCFKHADALAKIPLIQKDASVSYKMHSHSMEGAKLTLSFETVPQIPVIDPKKFQLKPVARPEVNPEKVEETIRQTQLFFAKWTPVTDRPVQENDFVLLDVDILEAEPKQKLFSNTRFEVTDRSMAKWMKDLVLGRSVGESIEGVSVADEDAKPEEKQQFAPKKVMVHINAIEEASYPPLDDAFAKQMGVQTVDDLRVRIEELLTKQADAHVRELEREQVTDFLLTEYPFDLPRSVIDRETQFRLQQLIQDTQFQNQWARINDEERRKLISTIKGQAEKAVRLFYLCRKVLSDAHLNVTAQDLPQSVNTPLEALLNPNAVMHDPRQPDVKQAEAFSRILLEKAEDWIIDHAKD